MNLCLIAAVFLYGKETVKVSVIAFGIVGNRNNDSPFGLIDRGRYIDRIRRFAIGELYGFHRAVRSVTASALSIFIGADFIIISLSHRKACIFIAGILAAADAFYHLISTVFRRRTVNPVSVGPGNLFPAEGDARLGRLFGRKAYFSQAGRQRRF